MKITETELPGVLVLTPAIYKDDRGAFWETWNQKAMAELGLRPIWVQDNFSVSKKNVIRGIHYQVIQPQGKLVRVAQGAVLDVAVDLRRGSSTFAKHVALELTGENGQMLWIPAGERTILWNDTDINIPWPVAPEEAIVAEKDRKGATLREAEVFA